MGLLDWMSEVVRVMGRATGWCGRRSIEKGGHGEQGRGKWKYVQRGCSGGLGRSDGR